MENESSAEKRINGSVAAREPQQWSDLTLHSGSPTKPSKWRLTFLARRIAYAVGMLNRLAILAIMMASVWSSKPIPGQTPDGNSHSSQRPKQQTDSSESQTTPTITLVKKDCNNEAFKSDTDCKAAEQKPAPVTIREPPTTHITIDRNAERDKYDWIAYSGDLLLVVVGIGTLIAVWIQAKRMKEHAKELKDVAAAANLNAQAVINAERALILFTIKKTEDKRGHAVFLISAQNFGKTPAREISISESKEIFTAFPEKLPSSPEYAPVKESFPYLVPAESHPITAFIPMKYGWAGKQVEAAKIEESDSKSVQPLIYGEVRYRDGISKEIRVSRYCLRFDLGPTPSNIGGQLIRCGPPEYNHTT